MSMTSTHSSRNASAQSAALRILSFIILLLGAIVLALAWNGIPDHWPVHWGLDGQPDRWSTKNFFEVFLPIGVGVLVCCFLETVAWIIKATARRRDEIAPETAAAIAALTVDLVHWIEVAVSIVFVYIGLAMPLIRDVRPVTFVAFVFIVISVAVVFGIIRLWRGVRNLKRAGHKGLEGYNGIIYRNPADRRLWVPKLTGIGYTLNFANPWAWPSLIAILAILVLVVLMRIGRS